MFLREPDGDLENTKMLREKIVRVIREVKPDVIFSFDPANQRFDSFGRFHRDHRVAAESVFDAMYPAAGSDVFFPELAKAGFSPHQVQGAWFFGPEKPNVWIDISKTIDKKLKALHSHESQINDARGLEKRIRDRARKEGRKKKMRYAETFRALVF